jgi:hypothetical protein
MFFPAGKTLLMLFMRESRLSSVPFTSLLLDIEGSFSGLEKGRVGASSTQGSVLDPLFRGGIAKIFVKPWGHEGNEGEFGEDLEILGPLLEILGEDLEILGSLLEILDALLEILGQDLEILGSLLEILDALPEILGQDLEILDALLEILGQDLEILDALLEILGQDLEIRSELVLLRLVLLLDRAAIERGPAGAAESSAARHLGAARRTEVEGSRAGLSGRRRSRGGLAGRARSRARPRRRALDANELVGVDPVPDGDGLDGDREVDRRPRRLVDVAVPVRRVPRRGEVARGDHRVSPITPELTGRDLDDLDGRNGAVLRRRLLEDEIEPGRMVHGERGTLDRGDSHAVRALRPGNGVGEHERGPDRDDDLLVELDGREGGPRGRGRRVPLLRGGASFLGSLRLDVLRVPRRLARASVRQGDEKDGGHGERLFEGPQGAHSLLRSG